MPKLDSNDKILDFAIGREEQAHEFYLKLAEQTSDDATRVLFEEFAQEELQHKEKLLQIKNSQNTEVLAKEVVDLKIAETLKKVEPTADMGYQEALILAMQREKEAYQMYMSLASRCEDEVLQRTLLAMAREEANHKMAFELEYDEIVLNEN
jgi:rubrerythrin